MKNSDYWKLRFAQLEESQNKLAEMSRNDIERLYRQATKDIEGKINTWYQRLASKQWCFHGGSAENVVRFGA